MNAKTERIDRGFAFTARLVIGVIAVFFMGVLSLGSLLHTTGMEIVHEGEGYFNIVNSLVENIESVIFYNDNILANVLWLGICIGVCILIMPLLKKLPLKYELIIVGVWVALLGIIWVSSSNSSPSEDSMVVTNASAEFARGDYSILTGDNRYFKNYSFQLGYVLFNELLIRFWGIFGEVKDVFFLEFFNVFFLVSSYIGIILINHKLFKDERVRHITVFMLMFCIQPIIFCVFVYGIIPGFAFAVWAVYFEILFLKSDELKKQIIFGCLSTLMISLAVLMKSNNLIVLVAMVIMAGVTMFKKKRAAFNIIFAVLWIVASIIPQSAVKGMYESRSGADLGDAIPFVSWISMGMNEAVNAPGWYNYVYTVYNYEEQGFDKNKAGEKSKEEIFNRLGYFNENKQYRNDFFYKKFMSQWNETSYQSIWNNKVRNQYAEPNGIAKFFREDGEAAAKRYMDIYSMFVFFTATIGIVIIMKRKNTLALTFPLIIIGGMLYHLLAEAKSQYALPYFILMVGVSAVGTVWLSDKLKPELIKLKGKLKTKKS